MPRKRGVARYCATRIKAGRLWALRQSPRSGVGSDEGEKEGREPGGKRTGKEETGLFDIVKMEHVARMERSEIRDWCHAARPPRIALRFMRATRRVHSGNALVSRPSARLGVPTCSSNACAKRNESRRPAIAALGRAALAPQLTDRPVCEPPQITLAVPSQAREAPG